MNSVELHYGRTTLYHLLQILKADNRKVLMETLSIVAWRWESMQQIKRYQSESYLNVYLDEKWFDSHDTASMVWSDNIEKCTRSAPTLKGKRIVTGHDGSTKGFVPNSLLICEKIISDHMLIIMTT